MKQLITAVILINGLMANIAIASTMNDCLIEQLEIATDAMTIGELKQHCQQMSVTSAEKGEPLTTVESAIKRRVGFERQQQQNPFSLQAHKPNYIILSNNMATPNERPFDTIAPNRGFDFQPWETKFQFSVKVPVAHSVIKGHGDLYVAYTNRSFWQMFNKDGSAPFRDSNHEPELWLSFKRDQDYFGWHNSVIRTGIVHQSNGQSGSLSRSWNRVYADFIFERENLYLSFKPWWRIPEDNDNDDNPNIDRYLGNFELSGVYKKGDHNFDFMFRNNLRTSDNHGAFQLGWSFEADWLPRNSRGYVQWFNGYGESLIDYDARSNSIGFGIKISDWL